MDSASFTVWRDFAEDLAGVAALAVGAFVSMTVAVGPVARAPAIFNSQSVCFMLGTIVSPPDAAAAEAMRERISLPGRHCAAKRREPAERRNPTSSAAVRGLCLSNRIIQPGRRRVVVCRRGQGGAAIGDVVGWLGVVVFRRRRSSELTITASLLRTVAVCVGADRPENELDLRQLVAESHLG